MKFLIVGTGSIGRRHFKNLSVLGYRDIAVLRSRRRMDKPQKEFFAAYRPKVFYDLKAALAERPDAVLVCNPTSLHVSTARSAIRAGAHVFIEKPISHTMAGVDGLLREARKRRKIIYVGYHFRHHPLLKKAKWIIDSGKLGHLHSAHFVNAEYLPGWHPWEDYRKSYASRRDLGGGVVLTQSHDLDFIQWLLGKPMSVMATIMTGEKLGIDSDASAAMIFKTKRCPSVLVNLNYYERLAEKRFTVSGSLGRLTWDYYKNALYVTGLNGKTRVLKAPPEFERNRMYIDEVRDFLLCIRYGRKPAMDGEAGRAVLEMALCAKKSSAQKRVAKL